MTPTEMMLLASYRGPAVELERICDRYLGLNPASAKRQAALKTLPFPAFRARDSAKAPYLVLITDLAKHIDSMHKAETVAWTQSQL